MPKLAMHWWILIGLVLGVAYGYVAAVNGASEHVLAYIKPFGTLFLNLLKMIAVPLVLRDGKETLNCCGQINECFD